MVERKERIVVIWKCSDGSEHASEALAHRHEAMCELSELLDDHLTGMTPSGTENEEIRDQVTKIMMAHAVQFNNILVRLAQ